MKRTISKTLDIRMSNHSPFILIFLLWILVGFTSHADINVYPEFVIASELTPTTSDIMNPGRPGIGFDGENYLVVTCREDALSDHILGVFVSADGSILTDLPIAEVDPVSGCSGKRPSVAFDGTNYLVVFPRVTSTGSTNVVGVWVTPAGAILDEPGEVTILLNVADNAVVAFGGSAHLVVSARYNFDTLHDIIGARVDTSGQVLEEFPIFVAPGGQVMASVAYDGNNYLVIWSDTRNGSPVGPDADIYGSRVSPDGDVLDPEGLPISTAPGAQAWPDIIFDGQHYFAVWEDTRNGPDEFPPSLDIYGARITPEGVLLDEAGIAVSTHPRPETHPSVIFNGAEYFATWDMSFYFDAPKGIFAARVSTNGTLIDGPPELPGLLLSNPDLTWDHQVWPNSIYGDGGVLVAWLNNTGLNGTDKDIAGVLVDFPSDLINIELDIIPRNDTNPIRPTSKGKLKVAVLSTDSFDAGTVDIDTVQFAAGSAEPLSSRLEDVNGDGMLDLVLKFKTQETGIACGDTDATLTGSTIIGEQFTGTDFIRTVGCR